MVKSKSKRDVHTLKRRLAILQMFPDDYEPNQTILSEMFGVPPLSINRDMKCVREVRAEIAGLKTQYEEKMASPAPAKPTKRKKWGRRVATVFGGTKETFKNQTPPERQDDDGTTHENGTD